MCTSIHFTFPFWSLLHAFAVCWFFSYTATSPNIKKPHGIERDRKISLHDSGVATLSRDVKSKLVQDPSPNQIDAGIKVKDDLAGMVPDKYLSFWLGLQQVRPKNPRSKHDGPQTSRNQPNVQVPGFALQTPSSGTAVHKSLLFFSLHSNYPKHQETKWHRKGQENQSS